MRALLEQWQLLAKGTTVAQLTAFLWSSYLTGMVLPGLIGTSTQLQLSFRDGEVPEELPFNFQTTVVDFDPRFSLLHSATELSGCQGTFADAEVWSHIRDDPATLAAL